MKLRIKTIEDVFHEYDGEEGWNWYDDENKLIITKKEGTTLIRIVFPFNSIIFCEEEYGAK